MKIKISISNEAYKKTVIKQLLQSSQVDGIMVNEGNMADLLGYPGEHVLNIGNYHYKKLIKDTTGVVDNYYIDEWFEHEKIYGMGAFPLIGIRDECNCRLTVGSILYMQEDNIPTPPKINFTFTAYRRTIQFLWWRIGIPFTNQIHHWQKYNDKFGERFPFVWINVLKNENDFEELIQWAYDHNKDVYLYVGKHHKVDERLLTSIKNFVAVANGIRNK